MALGTVLIRGDVGVKIRIDIREDMTVATNLILEVETPESRPLREWIPTANGNFLEYTTLDGDISEKGVYKVSPIITKGAFDGRALPVFFEVIDKFKP